MRTAVVLLALLALAAIPGSVLPQRNVATDPAAVPQFMAEHPRLSPWLDRLGLFEVYASPWFAATYGLLLVSMTGCVLPRCARLWREARAEPPKAPPRLDRFEHHRETSLDAPADVVVAQAAATLRGRGYRVVVDSEPDVPHTTGETGETVPGQAQARAEVRAEKGYAREIGNLAFHLSLLVLLVGVAGGKLFGFEGRVALAEGDTFTNVASSYDAFTPASLADVDGLTPFSMTLEELETAFAPTGPRTGEPRKFDAQVTYRTEGGSEASTSIAPNQPLDVNGTKLFLSGHGYAPRVTVRDGKGETVFSGPVIFLPSDGALTSDGVIKVPNAKPTQLGFEGLFLPTGTPMGGDVSQFPGLLAPRLDLVAYSGDLSMDTGVPQSVYSLDKTSLTEIESQSLRIGETMRLPDGAGSVTFDGVARFGNFQVAYDPGKEIALAAAVLLLIGLTVSLTVRRRRVWVRVTQYPDREGVQVETATRSLTRRSAPSEDTDKLMQTLNRLAPDLAPDLDPDLDPEAVRSLS
ncbi:cytochrome c biogenesis protein ResB [Nocardioides silvaticus]|jgi:cytochrome c biogenesis protein|nr:cytochrome c biogenesis protein ResB [Nocardioides silvaticus]